MTEFQRDVMPTHCDACGKPDRDKGHDWYVQSSTGWMIGHRCLECRAWICREALRAGYAHASVSGAH